MKTWLLYVQQLPWGIDATARTTPKSNDEGGTKNGAVRQSGKPMQFLVSILWGSSLVVHTREL